MLIIEFSKIRVLIKPTISRSAALKEQRINKREQRNQNAYRRALKRRKKNNNFIYCYIII